MNIEDNEPDDLVFKAKEFTVRGFLRAVGESPVSGAFNIEVGTVEIGATANVKGKLIKIEIDSETPILGNRAFIHRQGIIPSNDV